MDNLVNTKIIENYLIENNISKIKFCKICKTSVKTLDKVFNGEDYNLRVLFKIAVALDIKMCELFNKSL